METKTTKNYPNTLLYKMVWVLAGFRRNHPYCAGAELVRDITNYRKTSHRKLSNRYLDPYFMDHIDLGSEELDANEVKMYVDYILTMYEIPVKLEDGKGGIQYPCREFQKALTKVAEKLPDGIDHWDEAQTARASVIYMAKVLNAAFKG